MRAKRTIAFCTTKAGRYAGGLVVAFLLTLLVAGVAAAQDGSGDPVRGAQLYDANCAVCHGPDGKGRIGANLTSIFAGIQPDAFLRKIIATGISGTAMPAWQQPAGPLTAQDVNDLAVFVLSLSGGRPSDFPTPALKAITPIPTLPNVAGDPTQGAVVFAQNCAMCHGDQGQGRVGENLSKAFSGIRPDLSIRNIVATGISGSVMPAWSQANGGPLSNQEIDNVTAFVLTLPRTGIINTPAPGSVSTVPTVATSTSAVAVPLWVIAGLVAVLLLLAVAVIVFARAA